MSFQNVHAAVNKLIEEAPKYQSRFGFMLGDAVKCEVIGNNKTTYPDAVIVGFSNQSVQIMFPGGYKKYVIPIKLTKV